MPENSSQKRVSVAAPAPALLLEPIDHVANNDNAARNHSARRSRRPHGDQCGGAAFVAAPSDGADLHGLHLHLFGDDAAVGVIDLLGAR